MRKEVLGDNHPDTAISLNNLGTLFDNQGDLVQSQSYYEQALAVWKQNYGERHPMVASALVNLAAVEHAQGKLEESRRLYETALAINREIVGPRHPDVALALGGLGLLSWDQLDYPTARRHWDQSLAISQASLGKEHPATATALARMSSVDTAEKKWIAAAKHLDAARRIMRRHIAHVLPGLSEREQLLFLTENDTRMLYNGLTLGFLCPDEAEVRDLSAGWLLNGKALAQETLAQRALLSRISNDPKHAETIRQLIDTQRQLAASVLTTPKSGGEAAHRQQQEHLQQREQELSRQLAPSGSAAASPDPWVELGRVRAALPADSVLVDIARFPVRKSDADGSVSRWLPARYVAWIVPPMGKGETRIVDLGSAEQIDIAAEAVRLAIGGAQGNGQQQSPIDEREEIEAERLFREAADRLAALVLHPLLPAINEAKQLIISPDGALWLVPWAALPLPDGRYCVEEYELRYVVSGREAARSSAEKSRLSQPIVMADPDYDLAPAGVAAATQAVLRNGAPKRNATARGTASNRLVLSHVGRLPGTAAEAKAVAPKLAVYADAEPIVYTGKYALESVFKAAQRPCAVVLSTHGFFLSDQVLAPNDRTDAIRESRGNRMSVVGQPLENPLLRCGLLLAGCNKRPADTAESNDGVLTGMEIVGTDLRGTRLVVLSACETGLGQLRNGEGVAGLRQAFQLAGARTVVATLWQIPDRESAQLMSDFFLQLASGAEPAEALRRAAGNDPHPTGPVRCGPSFLLGRVYTHGIDSQPRNATVDSHRAFGRCSAGIYSCLPRSFGAGAHPSHRSHGQSGRGIWW